MKPWIKYTLLLTTTLAIGMVLGWMISGHLVRQRVHKYMKMKEKGGFEAHILEVTTPTDEQAAKIKPILSRHGSQMEALYTAHRARVDSTVKDLRDSLSLYLDTDQMKRYDESFKKRKSKRIGGRHGGGPAPICYYQVSDCANAQE